MTHQDEPSFDVGTDNWNQLGLTKREYFAALALQGLIAKFGTEFQVNHATDAVYYADSLITALNLQNSGSQ